MAAARQLSRATEIEPLVADAYEARARDLFERHGRRVESFCRWRLRNPEDAEDAMQTTFLQALRALRRGVVPVAEVPWLLTIAQNVCLTRIDSARRRAGHEIARDPQALADALPGRQADADDLFELDEALRVLPEAQRRAILLREWKGLSYREIADDLGVSLAACEALLFRARRGLAGRLSEGLEPGRKRLAGLLDLGALAGGLKSLAGGAAAVKVAAAGAVALTGVAVVTGAVPGLPSGSQGPVPARGETPAPIVRTAPDAGDAPRRAVRALTPGPAAKKPGRARTKPGQRTAGARPGAAPASGSAPATASAPGGPAASPPAGPVQAPAVETPPVQLPAVSPPSVPLPAALPPVEVPQVQVPLPPAPLPVPLPQVPAVEIPPVQLPVP